jgi:Cu+-exporting ATPase
MHREYHPEDMDHLRVHAFGANDHAHDHAHGAHGESHRGLFVLTAVLGILIAADLLIGWSGRPASRGWFWGISPIWIAAILGAARIVYGAIEALAAGRIGADFALAQACLAAIILGEPFVAAEVVFIALVGEALEAITADRAMRAIGHLFDRTPRRARVRRDGIELEVSIGEVRAGDTVIVAPGEKVAADGSIVSGRSSFDESMLTGEPIPVDRGPGEAVYAGSVNQFQQVEIRAEKVGQATTLGQVMRIVTDAQRKKSPLQRSADRYARWFLPVVEAVAGLTLLAGYLLGWSDVWQRAVAVLVVACPCALVLATPAAVMAALAWLARHGIVIKGGAALERLAQCDVVAFDKTGTLTEGRPELASIASLAGWPDDELLALAATAESASRHPIAVALRQAAEARGIPVGAVQEATALPGCGVSARWRSSPGAPEQLVLVGNRRMMDEQGIALEPGAAEALDRLDELGETALILALDGQVIGLIGVRDAVRPEAHDVVHDLKHLGFREIVMLTGDRPSAAKVVAKRTHIKTAEAERRPEEKAAWIRDSQASGRRVAMVGDGINDAPALATAHVGIALGRVGSDLAAEAGDVVILGEPLENLPDLFRLSRKTVAILRQNIIGFAFGLNALAMSLAFLGILGPVPAAILHQAGSLLVLLNSMRLLVFGDWPNLAPVRWLRATGRQIGRIDERLDPSALPSALVKHGRKLAAAVAAGLLALYLLSGWTEIRPDETGLLRRFGRFSGLLHPGAHWLWPWPIDQVDRFRPGAIRTVEVGYRTGWPDRADGPVGWESVHLAGTTALSEEESLILTGDGQLIELSAAVQFRLDPRPLSLQRYAFGSAGPTAALRPLAESVIRTMASRRTLDELLTSGRRQAEAEAEALLRGRVAAYGLGIEVISLAIQDAHPPRPVLSAYRDVAEADNERQTRINQGQSYRAEQLAQARGQAAAVVLNAEGQRGARIARASGSADAFLQAEEARRPAPALADHRRYWERLERILAGKVKVVIDPTRMSRSHLVLPESAAGAVSPSPALLEPVRPAHP